MGFGTVRGSGLPLGVLEHNPTDKGDYRMPSFVSGFFHVTLGPTQGFLRSCASLSRVAVYHFIVWIYPELFLQCPVDGLPGFPGWDYGEQSRYEHFVWRLDFRVLWLSSLSGLHPRPFRRFL